MFIDLDTLFCIGLGIFIFITLLIMGVFDHWTIIKAMRKRER